MLKFIVGLGRKLKPSITAAMPILLLTIFILLNIVIWWLGPSLLLNEIHPLESVLARGITCVIFTLICFSIWGGWQWKKLLKIKESQAEEEKRQYDPILQYEEKQERDLNKVMDNMEDNLNSRNYLYALPWYLVLGLETAGKTSLINRSGQNFVFSTVMKASSKKSDVPYGFDWWIGDDSVLIDPDGELLTQGQIENIKGGNVNTDITRRLWLNFINWIERTRSRRPLNGIILSIDIAHLANATEAERKAYANVLRARIRELMEKLSSRLPVYVCFTKLDLLYGFEPFFRSYTKEQREEVLGFTFSVNSADDCDLWLKEFSQSYTQFVNRINQALPSVAVNYSDPEERRAAYSFTRQIAGLQDTIYRLLDETLSSDQFSTSPLVRGVYLTSVFQQGVPSNVFDNAASRRYGLPHGINAAQQAKNSTIFFTPKLFKNIIYPEAGLASDNARVTNSKRRIMMASIIACSVAGVLLFSTWHRYYLKNVNQTEHVLTKVSDYQYQFTGQHGLFSKQDVLVALNKIREATLEFGYFRDKAEYFTDFGLYQGDIIGPKVEETYLNLLERKFLPLLMADLVYELEKAGSDEEKLAVLRVYRMLVDKSGRYPEYVLNYFSTYWQKQYSGQKIVQQQLLAHLDYAMQHTDITADRKNGDAEADKIMRPYAQTISAVQQYLGAMKDSERVYRNLKLNAYALMGPPVHLGNEIGLSFDMVYKKRMSLGDDLFIPQMLTKKGFDDYFMHQSESISKLALIDSWVLGKTQSTEFSKEDERVLRDEIRTLYAADYSNTWHRAINNIGIKEFSNLDDAVSILEDITGNLEPIQRLLKTIDNNTHLFTVDIGDELAQEELLKNPKFKVSKRIEDNFIELNALLKPQGENPAYITELLAVIGNLYDYMKLIQDSPNVGLSALNATKERVKLQSVDPIYTLQRVANGLPSPLDSMMASLAEQSWLVIKEEAINYLEVRWQNNVYETYRQNIAGRYPFVQNAKREVSLQDFEEFFAPGGVFDSFYNDQLKLFLTENIVSDNGSGSIIRPEILTQIKQVEKIQKAFFNRKGILDVNFSLQPLVLSNSKRRGVIDIDGQYLSYSHGQREDVDLIWPNMLGHAGISKLTLVPTRSNLSPRSIISKGEWSLFHLLDKATVVSASAKSVDFKFTVDEGEIVYRLSSDSDINPFTQSLFKSFRLSRDLY